MKILKFRKQPFKLNWPYSTQVQDIIKRTKKRLGQTNYYSELYYPLNDYEAYLMINDQLIKICFKKAFIYNTVRL